MTISPAKLLSAHLNSLFF